MSRILKHECVIIGGPLTLGKEAPAQEDGNSAASGLSESAVAEALAAFENAREQARLIIEQASERGLEAGYGEGRKVGLAEELKRDAKELEQIGSRLEAEIGAEQAAQHEACEKAEAAADALVFRLARRILHVALKQGDDAYLSLVAHAAHRVGETPQAVLKTGPRGYDIATRRRQEIEKGIQGLKKLEIRQEGEDDGLCVIETPYGNVDASIAVQLEKAAKTTGIVVSE